MADNQAGDDDLLFADEDRLRHEIHFLRGRVTNLEVFKKLFFTIQEDLVAERNKTAELQRQANGLVPEKISTPVVEEIVQDAGGLESQIHQLESDAENAQEMARLAMATMGEYGVVIDFFRESTTAVSYQDLVMLLFQALDNWKLQATVQIRCIHGELIFSKDDMKDHDTALINRFREQGRMVDYENMVIVNFTNVSLLARNFPLDKEQAGRIRDYLNTLCYGVNSRVDAIDANSKLKKERQNMFKIVTGAGKVMSNNQRHLGDNIRKIDSLYKALSKKLEDACLQLRLNDVQQKALNGLVQIGGKQLSLLLFEALTLSVDEKFLDVLQKLEQNYGNQMNSEVTAKQPPT